MLYFLIAYVVLVFIGVDALGELIATGHVKR